MKRRRVLLILLLLLLLGSLLLVPSLHWPVYGWLRGEAFYQGMPTSWWAKEIEANYEPINLADSALPAQVTWCTQVSPSIWDDFRQRFGPANAAIPTLHLVIGSPLLNGDPDVLPLLLTLMRNEFAKVRRVAVSGLRYQDKATPGVIQALLDTLKDPEPVVREEAKTVLWNLDPEAAIKAGAK